MAGILLRGRPHQGPARAPISADPTRSRVSMPSPDSGAGQCSSSTSSGPYLRASSAQIRPADSVTTARCPGSVSVVTHTQVDDTLPGLGGRQVTPERLVGDQLAERRQVRRRGRRQDFHRTILASLLLPYPCSILAWRSPVGRPARFMVAGRRRSVDRDECRGKGLVHAAAGSLRESRSRSVRRAAMPRAVWLFTAPQLMPIAAATSASERSA